jgi:hypothetical protein
VLQQAAVATIPWMVQRSGEWLRAPRAGFAAALLVALYAPLSLSAQVALSDALFAVLVAATALCFCRALASGRTRAFVVAGALAGIALAQRSSGAALLAAGIVALLLTRPRAHLRPCLAFSAAFATVVGLAGLKNRFDYGSFNVVQGTGIHLFCRVGAVDRRLPDTPEARWLLATARKHGMTNLFGSQAGWRLDALLIEKEKLSPAEADAVLEVVARQALLADPWRTTQRTWKSMTRAVSPDDPVRYELSSALRRSAVARLEPRIAALWDHHPEALASARALLPSYPPHAADDDPRFSFLETWARSSRCWCGSWILFALLLLGLFGLVRRDAAQVFLAGAAFAQLAASALGDAPFAGHFDPVAPLFLLSTASALTAIRHSMRAARSAPRISSIRE